MARIIQKSDQLANQYRGKRIRSVCAYVAALLCLLSVAFLDDWMGKDAIWLLVAGVGCIVGFVLGGKWGRDARILEVGIEGEHAVAELVRHLPDSYVVYRNVPVAREGKKSEIDLLVVGPNGVFVIEAKHWNGTLVGNYTGEDWVQHKVGRGGTPYSSSHRNPVKQVGRQVDYLAYTLRNSGVRTWVSGVVYLSNPEAQVQMYGTPDKAPVFAAAHGGARELWNYILSYTPRFPVSQQELQRIHQALSR